ncbi:MAG: hypothetical protein R3330_12220, partial [Saprospiraceae bacterium]|nr:hypothetical protein [Saprospiraceae bacterium]
YIGTVTFADGCVFSDTVVVDSDPTLPTVSGGPDMTLNCEVGSVILTAQVVTGNGPFMFEWTDTGGNVLSMRDTLQVSVPGSYFVQIFDQGGNCWSGKDAVEVTDVSNTPSAVISAAPGNVLSCLISSVILTHPDELNVSYTWLVQGIPYSSDSLEIFESGTVGLVALDTITLCSNRDSMAVTQFVAYPQISVEPYPELSCVTGSVVLDASASIVSNAGVFIWTNTDGDTLADAMMYQADTAGTYYLDLTDPENGCTSRDTFAVQDISHYPSVVASADLLLPCDRTVDTLSIEVLEPMTNYTVSWMSDGGNILAGGTTEEVVIDGAGIYIAVITDITSGCVTLDTAVVTAITNRPRIILAEAFETSCLANDDGMIILDGVEGGTPPYEVAVDGVPVVSSLEGLSPGIYEIAVVDAQGCTLDSTLEIHVGDEVGVTVEAMIRIKKGEAAELIGIVNIPQDEIAAVQWTPGTALSCDTCLVTSASPEESGLYTITVTDIYGCTASANVTLHVIEELLV